MIVPHHFLLPKSLPDTAIKELHVQAEKDSFSIGERISLGNGLGTPLWVITGIHTVLLSTISDTNSSKVAKVYYVEITVEECKE